MFENPERCPQKIRNKPSVTELAIKGLPKDYSGWLLFWVRVSCVVLDYECRKRKERLLPESLRPFAMNETLVGKRFLFRIMTLSTVKGGTKTTSLWNQYSIKIVLCQIKSSGRVIVWFRTCCVLLNTTLLYITYRRTWHPRTNYVLTNYFQQWKSFYV